VRFNLDRRTFGLSLTSIVFPGAFTSMFARPNAVQIRVSLDDIEPEIWRRLVVPIDWNLEQLHLTIQAAFNWWNYHLHEFRIGGLRYGDVAALADGSFEDDPRIFDEQEVRLRDFAGVGTRFSYLYDFGDDWHHTIDLEELLSHDDPPKKATCLDGAGARPPEDVGGIPGYEQFLEVINDPKNPEHAETKHWCGGHFDPEWFDLRTVDKDVQNALKPNVKRRLHQPKSRKAKTSS
jgi:hypothetical protein